MGVEVDEKIHVHLSLKTRGFRFEVMIYNTRRGVTGDERCEITVYHLRDIGVILWVTDCGILK